MANKPQQPLFPLGLATSEQSAMEGILNTGVIEHGPDAVMTLPEGNAIDGLPSSIRYNSETDEFEGYYAEGGWASLGGGGGIRWEALPHTETANLDAGRGYLIDNSNGVSKVVLPLASAIGESVTVCDAYGKFSVYPLTINGNGKAIYGSTTEMSISTDNVAATFTWTGEARGWVITSGVGLGQGRVYSRTIYTSVLASTTSKITLTQKPDVVDVYVDGKRLTESKYTLAGYDVNFSPALNSGSEVQIIEYTPIQLAVGGGDGGVSPMITWVYRNGSALGGETSITLDVDAPDVAEIFIRGARQQKGLGYTYDATTRIIQLADELEAGDDVIVKINSDPGLYNQIDRTPMEVARAYNVPLSSLVMSSDKSSTLGGKTIIYDEVAQKAWSLPAGIPSGAKIVSVSGATLTYTSSGSQSTVTLLDAPYTTAGTIMYNDNTIKSFLDSYFITSVNVRDPKYAGGAKGTWNSTTLTGPDDSAAFQAAIDALPTTYRNGGYRVIRVPAGNYKVSGLVLRTALEYGVMFVGDGKYCSIIWGDETAGVPIITSEIEFVHFHGLSLYGSRKQTTAPADWAPVFYKGKNAKNAPDIDVTFTDCALGHAIDFVEAHGRGVVIDPSCVAFFCNYLLNIVADPDIVFVSGHATNDVQTGMRNYSLCPTRTDVVSRMFRVTGTATCKDYINDINIKNVDMLSADILGEFADATITGLNVVGVSGLNSFSSGLLDGKRLLFSTLDVNTAKQYNRDVASTAFMFGVVKLSQGFQGLRIRGFYRDLVRYVVQVNAVSAGLDIDIQIANIAVDGTAFTAVTGANVISSQINIITTGIATSAACSFFTAAQTDPKFVCNAYGTNFARPGVSYNPNLLVGGTAQTPVGRSATYRMEGGLVYVDLAYTYTRAGTTASQISISLPTVPAAEYPTLSSAISGRVHVKFSSLKTAFRGEIVPASSSIVFYKPDGTTLTEADLPSTFTITLQAVYPAY